MFLIQNFPVLSETGRLSSKIPVLKGFLLNILPLLWYGTVVRYDTSRTATGTALPGNPGALEFG